MDKKKALFHAIVTVIVVYVILGAIMCGCYGFFLLMERVYDARFRLLAIMVPAFWVAVIVAVSAYRYFRKEG